MDLQQAMPSVPAMTGAAMIDGGDGLDVGPQGGVSASIVLPISAARSLSPPLLLVYQGGREQGEFGRGWSLTLPALSRQLSKGVPAYDDDDIVVGPAGQVLLSPPETPGGLPRERMASTFRGVSLGAAFNVTSYVSRGRADGTRWERWRHASTCFWLAHDANGVVHLYGRTERTEEEDGLHAVIWHLQESVSPMGEHVLYEYARENNDGLSDDDLRRDHSRRRYLRRVRYGNAIASLCPYLLPEKPAIDTAWLFDLIFDYGERDDAEGVPPSYEGARAWLRRPDARATFASGFEVRTYRRCRQVVMYHTFPGELGMGDVPTAVARMLFDYEHDASGSRLVSAQLTGFGPEGEYETKPPREFRYARMPAIGTATFEPFDAMSRVVGMFGLGTTRERCRFVDLYGDGVPGLLVQRGAQWRYSEPLRGDTEGDAIAFGPMRLLNEVPAAGGAGRSLQWLTDIDGDGRLEWIVAKPGRTVCYRIGADRRWSVAAWDGALPPEFFTAPVTVVDLTGDGLADVALLGTRSARYYANAGGGRFESPVDVGHDGDTLPGRSDGRAASVVFADLLGSGQPQLVEIRHDRIAVWPSLGRGHFGMCIDFARLPFDEREFDPSRVLLADLGGTGCADLLYLRSTHVEVFRNDAGEGLAVPEQLRWPEGVRYDSLCDVSVADFYGLGCASLVLTVRDGAVRHWRCDVAKNVKPHALVECDNNMGRADAVVYRGSAQEWLDEKSEGAQTTSNGLPFSVPVVVTIRHTDQVTGAVAESSYRYRHGGFDPTEREFRGFGLTIRTDRQWVPNVDEGAMPTIESRLWFHAGDGLAAGREGFDEQDTAAIRLRPDFCTDYVADRDLRNEAPDEVLSRDAVQILNGRLRRVERRALDGGSDVPVSIEAFRYQVRRYHARGKGLSHTDLQVMLAESVAYQYERHVGDPQCRQVFQWGWDRHGALRRQAEVAHARRSGATPPFSPDIDDYEYHLRWWTDAHDEAQDNFYLNDHLFGPIHIDADPDWWRLHLPCRQCSRAAAMTAEQLPARLLDHEGMSGSESPLNRPDFVISGQTTVRYVDAVDGKGDIHGRVAYTETAEFDEQAQAVYDEVLTRAELAVKLEEAGYRRMPSLLPGNEWPWTDVAPGDKEYWGARRSLATFAGIERFFRMTSWRDSECVGATDVTHDVHGLFPACIRLPDGCETHVDYDYWRLRAFRTVDPNETVREVRYSPLGYDVATTIHGKEYGQRAGFEPMSAFRRDIVDLDAAVAAPAAAVQDAATVTCYDMAGWMGKVDGATVEAVRKAGYGAWLSAEGHVKASARWAMDDGTSLTLSPALVQTLRGARRRPVRMATLVADQYTHHATPPLHPAHVGLANPPVWTPPPKQYRTDVTAYDGRGQVFQSKQKVPPGEAFATRDGEVAMGHDGKPVTVEADPRWRVRTPAVADDSGRPLHVYRPYFSDTHDVVGEEGYRATSYVDRHYYDESGRLVVTLTASGYMRRNTYYPWHTVSEDENDTADELEEIKTVNAPDGARLGKRPGWR